MADKILASFAASGAVPMCLHFLMLLYAEIRVNNGYKTVLAVDAPLVLRAHQGSFTQIGAHCRMNGGFLQDKRYAMARHAVK